MSLYSIKKIRGKRKIVWNIGRRRGVKDAVGRIGDIYAWIKPLVKKNPKIKVLEVGCGYGRALFDLKKQFPQIEIHGINLEPRWNLNLIRKFALSEKIFTQKDIDKNLPKIHIINAGKKLPFKDNTFDFIFCQATMQYIPNKILFIEEANRILTKKGLAVLELQEFRDEHPFEYKSMIEIWKGREKIDFIKYLKKFKNIQVKKSTGRDWHYIIMKKAKNLNFKLKFVDCINLEGVLPNWWGKKTVYTAVK